MYVYVWMHVCLLFVLFSIHIWICGLFVLFSQFPFQLLFKKQLKSSVIHKRLFNRCLRTRWRMVHVMCVRDALINTDIGACFELHL